METQSATPETVQGIEFDSNGEMQFTEEGFKGFKALLDSDVNETNQPESEVAEEEPKDKEPEQQEVKETPKEVAKRKLKVDGEIIEKTEEEVESLAQMGLDYTKKMQALAEEKRSLSPYEGLIKQLQTDPNLSQHIANYWQKPEKVETPHFDDPIEQLKYEIKQEVIRETKREIEEKVTPLHKQAVLNDVKTRVQSDPDYAVVHKAIIDMVASQPPSLQKNMYLQLDQDPASYLEAFQHFKTQINSLKTEPKNEAKSPEPVKKTERAPILEASNNTPSEETVKGQRVKLDKARARALREGSVDALQEFLITGGFLEHLK